MRQIFLIFFFSQILTAFGQRSEVGIHYRYGIAVNKIGLIEPNSINHLDYKHINTVWDQGLLLDYNYIFWKKYKLAVNICIDYSGSKHGLEVTNGGGGYHLDNIVVRQNRISFKLGLIKRISLIREKLELNCQLRLVNRNYTSSIREYKQDLTQSHLDWIMYDYELTAYYEEQFANTGGITIAKPSLNLEYSVGLDFIIKKGFRVYFGFDYSRNNVFFYNFNYNVYGFSGGSPTPTSIYTNAGIQDPYKFGVKDHFFYIRTGIFYTIGKSQKN